MQKLWSRLTVNKLKILKSGVKRIKRSHPRSVKRIKRKRSKELQLRAWKFQILLHRKTQLTLLKWDKLAAETLKAITQTMDMKKLIQRTKTALVMNISMWKAFTAWCRCCPQQIVTIEIWYLQLAMEVWSLSSIVLLNFTKPKTRLPQMRRMWETKFCREKRPRWILICCSKLEWWVAKEFFSLWFFTTLIKKKLAK